MIAIRTRFRRGETNKTLMIFLAVALVIAGGFWGYKLVTTEKAPVVVNTEPVTFYCDNCKKTFEVPADEAAKMKIDKATNKYECKICKKMTAEKGFGPNPRMRTP